MKRLLLLCGVFVLMHCSMNVYAQDRTVSGRVTSTEDGTPLPGVNVVLKGTTTGTATDSDGKYTLSVPPSGGSLIFSFIGLDSKEVPIGDQAIVNVSLALDITQLSEVVVTALNIAVDRDRIGSASTQVGGSAIKGSGEATLINGLQGKTSGVVINRTSGDPGAGSYIQIRGQSSITRSVQPLVVVDGVPSFNSGGGGTSGVVQQSRLNDLNPNDIESIEVLKGAAASALFGTRAGNGVIMVTTKKGANGKGKVNISYSGTYSQDRILVKHPLQKRWGQGLSGYYMTNENGAQNNWLGNTGNSWSWGDFIPDRTGGADVIIQPGQPGYQGYYEAEDGTQYYQVVEPTLWSGGTDTHGGKNSKKTYDPYDQLFKTGSYFENNISVSGGDQNGTIFASVSNMDQTGIIRGNSDYKKTTFRVNADRKLSDWFKMTSNFSYMHISSSRIQQGSNVNGLFLSGLRSAPDFDNRDYNGVYYDAFGVANLQRQRSYRSHIGRRIPAYDNPLWVTNENIDRSNVDRITGMLQFDIKATKWLTFTARGGVDHYSDKRKTLFPFNTAGALASGQLTLQTPRETQWNFDGFANGAFQLTPDLSLGAIVGLNLNQQTSDNIGGTTQNFIINLNTPDDITNATSTNRVPFNSFAAVRRAALYSTVDLAYKEQLFVNLTGRAERSSTFSYKDNPLFIYPSITTAWQFTKTFGIENKYLSFGKLRASYGVVANVPGAYAGVTYFNNSVYGESWGSTLSASAYAGGGYEQSSLYGNPNLKPETKTEYEVGGDFRFLDNRLTLGVTYFNNTVKDVLLNIAVAPSTGFTNNTSNVAELNNKGIELDLGGDVIRKGDFTWNLYGNWTRIRNEVVDLAGSSSILLAGFTGTSSRAVKGYPVGVLWGVKYDRDTEGKYVLDSNGFPKAAAQESVVGNPNPDWRAGLGSTFSWKGFRLNILFEHSHGGDIWGGTRGALMYFGTHKDTDKMVTLSNADANSSTLINYSGDNAVDWGYPANADGTYTIRGEIKDFGAGPVLVDEAWYQSLGGGFGVQTEDFIEKAQWTKLRELTLGYTLNSDGFRKTTKLSSIDFSITGRNLFLWTDFKGNDPETNLTGPSNGRGMDYFNNPATKSYVFSIKINY